MAFHKRFQNWKQGSLKRAMRKGPGSAGALVETGLVLEPHADTELDRARCADGEHARTQSRKQGKAAGLSGPVDGSGSAIEGACECRVGPVVIVPIEEIKDSDLRLNLKPFDVTDRPDCPPEANVEGEESVVTHISRRRGSDLKLRFSCCAVADWRERRRNGTKLFELRLREQPGAD